MRRPRTSEISPIYIIPTSPIFLVLMLIPVSIRYGYFPTISGASKLASFSPAWFAGVFPLMSLMAMFTICFLITYVLLSVFGNILFHTTNPVILVFLFMLLLTYNPYRCHLALCSLYFIIFTFIILMLYSLLFSYVSNVN